MFSLSQAMVLTEDASSGGLLRVWSLGHSQDHIAVHVCMLPRAIPDTGNCAKDRARSSTQRGAAACSQHAIVPRM